MSLAPRSDAVLTACDQTKVKIAVAHQGWLHPATLHAQRLVQKGEVSCLRLVRGYGKMDHRDEGQERSPLEEGTEFIHLGFLVDDLAATHRRLLALGAPVVRDDVKERRAHGDAGIPVGSLKALDSDGNVIDISDRRDEWRVS